MKVTYKILLLFLGLSFASCGVSKSLHDVPDVSMFNPSIPEREKISDSSFTTENGYLTKNKFGQWDLYVSGDPYQMGLNTGSLTEECIKKYKHVYLYILNELVYS